MRFYNREAELQSLENIISAKGHALIVISGRRRVGKTRLVDEFLRRYPALRIMIVPKEERQVASDFSDIYGNKGFKPSLATVKASLEYFFAVEDTRILFIDEFSNFLEVNKSIPYELQRLWDENQEKNKILILSGSYVRMMNRIFTEQKAPLFNRATLKILLDPLGHNVIWDILTDMHVQDPREKILLYCIFGGIPYYYEVMERIGSRNPVQELFFNPGTLREEGQDLLRQEFGSGYRKYFSILDAVGSGLASPSEIANKLGLKQTTISKYIYALQNDFKLLVRQVPFTENPRRSKKGRYFIADNTLAFWFSHVYGRSTPPTVEEINTFVGKRFEVLCLAFLERWLIRKGERVLKKGKWWGPVKTSSGTYERREIDLVIETERMIYAAECKWTSDAMGKNEIIRLRESALGLNAKKPLRMVLFAKNGFTIKESEDVLLFTPDAIVNCPA